MVLKLKNNTKPIRYEWAFSFLYFGRDRLVAKVQYTLRLYALLQRDGRAIHATLVAYSYPSRSLM